VEEVIDQPKNGAFVLHMEGSTQLLYLTVLTFIIAIFLTFIIAIFLYLFYELLNGLGIVINVIPLQSS